VSLPTKLNSYKKNESGDNLITSDTKWKLYQPSFRFWCKEFKIKELYITSSKINENQAHDISIKCETSLLDTYSNPTHNMSEILTFLQLLVEDSKH
jgi:hypothetical protein